MVTNRYLTSPIYSSRAINKIVTADIAGFSLYSTKLISYSGLSFPHSETIRIDKIFLIEFTISSYFIGRIRSTRFYKNSIIYEALIISFLSENGIISLRKMRQCLLRHIIKYVTSPLHTAVWL